MEKITKATYKGLKEDEEPELYPAPFVIVPDDMSPSRLDILPTNNKFITVIKIDKLLWWDKRLPNE